VLISPVVIALLGFLVAATSALLAGGVAWGVFRATLDRQREEISHLTGEVKALSITVNDLSRQVAVLTDRHARSTPPPIPHA